MTNKETNITWHSHAITQADREKLLSQKGSLIWFTGLSGAGKSTIASALEESLHAKNKATYVLDGDNVRKGLNNNLSFSPEDRTENIRRVGEVGKLFADAGLICIAAFISPYEKDRQLVRDILPRRFIEVHIATNPNITISTANKSVQECVLEIMKYLKENKYLE